LTLFFEEQRGKLQDSLEVQIGPVELQVLVQATLKELDLLSQALNVVPNLLNLSEILDHEPVSMNGLLDVHRREHLDCEVVFELQPIQLNTEDLGQPRDPINLDGWSLLSLRSLIVFDLVLVHVFPSLIHVLGVEHIEHDLNEGILDLLVLFLTL